VAEVRSERLNSIRFFFGSCMTNLPSSFSLTRSNDAHAQRERERGEEGRGRRRREGRHQHDPTGCTYEPMYGHHLRLCRVALHPISACNKITRNAFHYNLHTRESLLLPTKVKETV
jgi:hypothetical protein